MAKQMVSLEYMFIFSKDANIWNHLYEFEKDLADFFAANKLEAEPITTIEGASGKRIMIIRKMEEAVPTLENEKGVDLTTQEYQAQTKMPKKPSTQKSASMVKDMTKRITNSMKGKK